MKWNKPFRLILIFIFSISVLVLFQIRCRHDGLNVTTFDKVCYERDIAPIFQSCSAPTGCHNKQGGESEYAFTDYNSVMKAITPFNANKSKAYQAITGKGFMQLMPPSGALPMADRILIRVWIDQGAEQTTCTATGVGISTSTGEKVCFQRDILPVLVSSCGSTRTNGTTIVGCHDQASREEGYLVTSYSTIMSNLVVAGSPSSSRLYSVIARSPSSENFMPPRPYPALSSAVKDSIFNWIKNGAKNDVCASLCDTTGVITYQNQISSLMSKYCTSCHTGVNASKGILLDSYLQVKVYLDNGKLIAAVKGTSIQMPPGYKISSCELREIELWKANGATQN